MVLGSMEYRTGNGFHRYNGKVSSSSLVPETKLERIVIIGGGFGGIELVKRLDKKRFQVVMIDRNNYHIFQPLLYQVATGGLAPDSVSFPIRKIFSKSKNFVFRMAEALEVNKTKSVLITDLGKIRYDYLVIATGSSTNYFGNEEIRKSTMPLKNITDALDLRSLILENFEKLLTEKNSSERKKYFNIVVVGGGPTGVELAGALSELKKYVLPNDYPELNFRELQIHLVEASGKLLGGMSKEASDKTKNFLIQMGVKLWLNSSVSHYLNEEVILDDTKSIKCKTLIWTAGVKGDPINGFLDDELTKSKRIKTDMYNCLIGSENIFVIGDVAAVTDPDLIEPHPMLAQVAIQQAKNLAHNLNIKDKKMWQKFNYKHKGAMATIGRNKAVVDLKYFHFQGIFAWYIWMFVHLVSIIGFRNRLIVLINWIWNYFSYDRAIRLIIRPYKRKSHLSLAVKTILLLLIPLLYLLKKNVIP